MPDWTILIHRDSRITVSKARWWSIKAHHSFELLDNTFCITVCSKKTASTVAQLSRNPNCVSWKTSINLYVRSVIHVLLSEFWWIHYMLWNSFCVRVISTWKKYYIVMNCAVAYNNSFSVFIGNQHIQCLWPFTQHITFKYDQDTHNTKNIQHKVWKERKRKRNAKKERKTLCVTHKSQVHIWKVNGKIGGQRSKDGLFCHVSAVTQSNIDWPFNNLVQMFS